jgi:hypothetical protein
MKRILDAEKDGINDEDRRILLLSEDLGENLLLPELPPSLKDFYTNNDARPELYILKVSYENIPVEEVLRRILPAEVR